MEKKVIGALIIGAAVGATLGIVISKSGKNSEKQKLVDAIMQKYGKEPGFEGNPDFMMKQSIPWLKGVLAGYIH